nr:DUF1906 domain-containing protein [Corynebacterium sp. Marseille-P8863]
MTTFNRRRLLQTTALAVAGATLGSTVQAHAQSRILGTVIDYSAGVPSGAAVKAAGHMGAVRYVSQPRPGAEWMKGKPVTIGETQDFAANGLATASVYQFGRAETADWKEGAAGVAKHAPQAIRLHQAAGGPNGRPVYIAIDDNPTRDQYVNQIRPYLQAFQLALKAAGLLTGVYGNYNVIQWCVEDRIGSFFWQHDWGSNGRIHPSANIHQKAGFVGTVGGVQVDINNVYASDWGQWTPGRANPLPIPDINALVQGSSQLSSQVDWRRFLP